MKKVREHYKTLMEIGIPEQSNAEERLMLRTINFTTSSLILIFFVVAFVNFYLQVSLNGIFYIMLSVLLCINFIWVKLGKFYLAKIITVYPIFFLPFFNIIIQGYLPDHQYLGLVGITILGVYQCTIIFDQQKEEYTYWFTIFFIFVYTFFYDSFFQSISIVKPDIALLQDNYLMFKFFHFLLIATTASLLYYLKRLLQSYQLTIKLQHDLLQKINSSLEEQINDKTKTIEASKTKIAELAFLTSHKVRSPISSILGMVKIINDENSYKMVKDVFPKLYQKALSMDEVIKEMNDKIQEELEE